MAYGCVMPAIVLLLFETVALIVLAAAGRSVVSWQTHSAGDLVVICLVFTGIAVASWLLASTIAYMVSTALGRQVGARLLPRVLRHVVDAAFVSALVVSPVTPAAAAGFDQAGVPLPPGVQTVATSTVAPGRHVVESGESLWSIAAAETARRGDGSSVGTYWRRVVAVNEPHLRSGDPDLIYPGEEIILPTS